MDGTVKTQTLFGEIERERWEMPDWMEPYRDLLPDGDRAEELMNCTATTFENDVLALMAVDMKSAVAMLTKLHSRGLLRPREELADPEEKQLGPFVRDSDTSRKAAIAAYPKQGTQRRRVLEAVADGDLHGVRPGVGGAPTFKRIQGRVIRGLTRDRIAEKTGLSPNTVRPRVVELVAGGWLREAEEVTALSQAGQDAAVLELTDAAREWVISAGGPWVNW